MEERQDKPRKPVKRTSSPLSLLRSRAAPQRRRDPAATVSFDPNLTQQSLPYGDVELPPGVGLRSYARLPPFSVSIYPTAHGFATNPGFFNLKRCTSPRTQPVYRWGTVVGGVACSCRSLSREWDLVGQWSRLSTTIHCIRTQGCEAGCVANLNIVSERHKRLTSIVDTPRCLDIAVAGKSIR